MLETILRLLVYSAGVLITAYILPGVHIEKFWLAVVVASVLTLLNAFLKPVLIILTIPVTIMTLGLFLLVINALIIIFTAYIIPGFEVDSFWWALLFSIVLSFFSLVFRANTSDEKKIF
jgi:putative membrane protein